MDPKEGWEQIKNLIDKASNVGTASSIKTRLKISIYHHVVDKVKEELKQKQEEFRAL